MYVVMSSGGPRKDCTVEGAQSTTGFGGQVGNVAFPGKIMADSETQKLKRKDFFHLAVRQLL